MLTCDEARHCAFFASYSQQAGFRREHFSYFCLGPLAEGCARRAYSRQHGHPPRADLSPLGVPFKAAGTSH